MESPGNDSCRLGNRLKYKAGTEKSVSHFILQKFLFIELNKTFEKLNSCIDFS